MDLLVLLGIDLSGEMIAVQLVLGSLDADNPAHGPITQHTQLSEHV